MNKRTIIYTALLGIFALVFAVSAYMVIHTLLQAKHEQATFDELSALATGTSGTSGDSNQSGNPCPLCELNTDYYGWLSIAGTHINYPVMYTPQESEYYLRRDFYGEYSHSGTPFIDSDCPTDGSYLLIYGHHMNNGTMFGDLPKYAEKDFYKAHKTFTFTTRDGNHEYEVIASFYSRIYDSNETDVFRYYAYTDLSDQQMFDEYMEQVNASALFDTGVSAEFGDSIIVLSTCNYHTDDGRFVVVAKKK